MYKITSDRRFREAAEKAADFLVENEKVRSENFSYWSIKDCKGNYLHGLIGQAWAIEALSEAYQKLGDRKYKEVAREVFKAHPFDEDIGLWRRVDPDGTVRNIDPTLDHQTMFAAAASLLNSKNSKEYVEKFLSSLTENMKIYKNGLIKHKVNQDRFFESKLKLALSKLRKRLNLRERMLKEVGYQSYILYSLCLLYREFPDDDF